ncbi:MAG: hypothetical protein ABEK36_06370 [Candidatus Aenigmatarchaeota archaeon]
MPITDRAWAGYMASLTLRFYCFYVAIGIVITIGYTAANFPFRVYSSKGDIRSCDNIGTNY